MPGDLSAYRRKRRPDRTPEPMGEGAPGTPAEDARVEAGDGDHTGLARFVIQRHRARRTLYDVRFEIGGVLVSFAVPKGLTLDPAARHLAVHVEDHPLDYELFEGVIPAGEYGAGDVIVWDRGTWELHGASDPAVAVADGELHVELHGEKLRGRLLFVRRGTERGKEQWLALHKRDEYAVDGWNPDDHPRSVLSGRTNEEVAADPDRVWTGAGEQTLPRAPSGSVPSDPAFAAPDADELAALDALGTKGTWRFQGHELRLTNLDKVLFPAGADGVPVTKCDLIRYYACIAPVMLPHLRGRPLRLHRYPDGVERPALWQEQTPARAPHWIPRRRAGTGPGTSEQVLMADHPAVLAWLANRAAIEIHISASTPTGVHGPTYAVADIDPGPATSWGDVLVLARLHRTALDHLGVIGFPQVTGARGIQIWIPVVPGRSSDEAQAWVEVLSRTVASAVPDLASGTSVAPARGRRIRPDGAPHTITAPYSVRPAPGAPVAMPIGWDELDDPALAPDRWTIRTAPGRVAERGDLMATAPTVRQHLPQLG